MATKKTTKKVNGQPNFLSSLPWRDRYNLGYQFTREGVGMLLDELEELQGDYDSLYEEKEELGRDYDSLCEEKEKLERDYENLMASGVVS